MCEGNGGQPEEVETKCSQIPSIVVLQYSNRGTQAPSLGKTCASERQNDCTDRACLSWLDFEA